MSALTKLGKYDIKRELGKGAMGVVYEGFDPFIERTVAIKTILKSSLDAAEAQDMINRFRREAQAAGRLTHPNICGIYEYGEDGDVAFIAMEFLKGQELKKLFDEEARFKVPDAVKIMLQLLDALNYSHERGVVHRDIKPANIIITETGQVKVADFGIARIESSHLTQAGTVLGTPTHMSPEQFMGLTVDNRSDLYSAGVILYQFLTGERPFTGSVVTIMHKVINQEPIAPSALNFSVPRALDAVVKKALAKKPEDRFQSGAEFAAALKAAAEMPAGADTDATFIGVGVGAGGDPDATMAGIDSTQKIDAASATQTIQTKPAPKAGRSAAAQTAAAAPAPESTPEKKSPMVAIIAGVAVLAGAGAWFALRPAEEPPVVVAPPTAPKVAKATPAPATPTTPAAAPAPVAEPAAPTAAPAAPATPLTPAEKAKQDKEKAEKAKLERERAEKERRDKEQRDKEQQLAQTQKETELANLRARAEAAERARLEAEIRAKVEAEKKTTVAAVAVAPPPSAPAGPSGVALYERGLKQEREGSLADALKSFTGAANAGYAPAMKKLGDIYGKGNEAVPRDYAASIKWYNQAKQAGANVPKDTR